ncbi:MAG: non-homologous end-joining DNA ligase [Anaerolineales bacterium]
MRVGQRQIDVSNRDKVFFPDAGLTKADLIDYYGKVADTMLTHLKRYGVSMHRWPDGIEGEDFYNKDAPDYFPDWIKTFNFPKREGGSFNAPVVDSKAALIYLADKAVITFHTYLSRPNSLEQPDKMIYDLDPPEDAGDYGSVRQAALDMRGVLAELDLKCWVQTTGSKGFHVIVPLDGSESFDDVRGFARSVARVLVRRHSDRYTIEQRKKKRQGKIFLDMLRNAYGATSVAPYSVRALPSAPVATPVTWQEVEGGVSPRAWTMENIPRRLGQTDDPWSGMIRHAVSLGGRRDQLEKLLEQEEPAEEEKD